jgi:hypothetical protein
MPYNLTDLSANPLFDSNVAYNETLLQLMESYAVSMKYYMQLQRENKFLTLDNSNNEMDLHTNNRKTFYENQFTEGLNQNYKLWFFMYMFFFVIYVYLSFFIIVNANLNITIVKCLLLFIYPFITHFLSEIILSLVLKVSSTVYANPYFNIQPSSPPFNPTYTNTRYVEFKS